MARDTHVRMFPMLLAAAIAVIVTDVASGFAPSSSGVKSAGQTNSLWMNRIRGECIDEEEEPSRRRFFNHVLLGASSAVGIFFGADVASAVDFPDISKLGNNGPNKQRIGGLANKIRNSCRIMVTIHMLNRL